MSAHLGTPPGDAGAARVIPCVETHTCGEPTRIVTMLDIPGSTIVEKQAFVRSHLDHVRQALIREPRGHRDMFGAILTRPVTPEAAAGVIWLDHGGYLCGCGHATIGVGIAMVETGMVMGEIPVTVVLPRLAERPPAAPGRQARRARARDHVRERRGVHGGVDLKVDVPDVGSVRLDVAFGGNFFAALDAASVGVSVQPEQASRLVALGLKGLEREGQCRRDEDRRRVMLHRPYLLPGTIIDAVWTTKNAMTTLGGSVAHNGSAVAQGEYVPLGHPRLE
jgi:proline racemase